jgi:hypothetical protein
MVLRVREYIKRNKFPFQKCFFYAIILICYFTDSDETYSHIR